MSIATMIVAAVLQSSAWQPPAYINWFVSVPEADSESGRAAEYRIYDEPGELLLVVGLSNTNESALTITQAGLSRDVSFRLLSPKLEVIAEWEPVIFENTGPPASVSPDGPVRLASANGMGFRVRLRRVDGEPFTPDKYAIGVSLGLSGARDDADMPWKGHLSMRQTAVFVVTGPPSASSTDERAAAQRQIARRAAADGRRSDAVRALEAALAINPVDDRAQLELAEVFLNMKRYAEAAGHLKTLRTRFPKERQHMPVFLARALVGMRDEAEAVRVLREAGRTPAEANQAVARLRAELLRGR